MATRRNGAQEPKTLLDGKPYVCAEQTDVGATFARVREQIRRDVAARVRSERRARMAALAEEGVPGSGREEEGTGEDTDAERGHQHDLDDEEIT